MAERARERFRQVAKIAYPILNVVDIATTGIGLSQGYIDANPLFNHAPFPALAALRLAQIPAFFLLFRGLEYAEGDSRVAKRIVDGFVGGVVGLTGIFDATNIVHLSGGHIFNPTF